MLIAYGDFELDDDLDRVDLDALWAFLSQRAYWGPPAGPHNL